MKNKLIHPIFISPSMIQFANILWYLLKTQISLLYFFESYFDYVCNNRKSNFAFFI